MKKINLLILGVILLVPSIAMANSIKNIDIDIYVDSIGTAHVTEIWDTYLNEGTEGYKPYYNWGTSEITNFKVKINGEVWSAKTDDESSIAKGTEVEVLKIDGVKLVVSPIRVTSVL